MHSHLKRSVAIVFFLLLSSMHPCRSQAQTAPGQTEQVPQPGQLGSPFPVEHSWNHLGLEISGGYAPVVSKGAGYFDKGFMVTAGVVDHFSPRWSALVEANFFGLNGEYSNTDFGVVLGGSYNLLPRHDTGPYVIGGAGYYLLGAVPPSDLSQPCFSTLCPVNSLNAASAFGFNGGAGLRRRLYAGRAMEIFAEGRYHYVASGSTAIGQISILPITAGIRW